MNTQQILHSLKNRVDQFPILLKHRQFEWEHRAPLHVLEDFWKSEPAIRPLFELQHQQYITNISQVNWAASLETCDVLYYLCQQKLPKVIIDIGSGFSSYVLRTYQAKESPTSIVYSIDDDDAWLTRTSEFLRKMDVSNANLFLWADFIRLKQPPKADLIFYDLNVPQVRIPFIPTLLNFVHHDTILIFDDVHKVNMRVAVEQFIQANHLKFHNLMDLTKDSIGRFSWCVYGF